MCQKCKSYGVLFRCTKCGSVYCTACDAKYSSSCPRCGDGGEKKPL